MPKPRTKHDRSIHRHSSVWTILSVPVRQRPCTGEPDFTYMITLEVFL